MQVKVRLNIDGWRKKLARAKREIPAHLEKALQELAEEAVRLVSGASAGSQRVFIRRQLGRQFKEVFEGRRLKGTRKERWPNLAPIYQARIVRGQSKYQGRKVFYVDRTKENALFQQLASTALRQAEEDSYEVRFHRSGRRFFCEIIKRGATDGKTKKIPPVVISYVRDRLAVSGKKAIRQSLRSAGFKP